MLKNVHMILSLERIDICDWNLNLFKIVKTVEWKNIV